MKKKLHKMVVEPANQEKKTQVKLWESFPATFEVFFF